MVTLMHLEQGTFDNVLLCYNIPKKEKPIIIESSTLEHVRWPTMYQQHIKHKSIYT